MGVPRLLLSSEADPNAPDCQSGSSSTSLLAGSSKPGPSSHRSFSGTARATAVSAVRGIASFLQFRLPGAQHGITTVIFKQEQHLCVQLAVGIGAMHCCGKACFACGGGGSACPRGLRPGPRFARVRPATTAAAQTGPMQLCHESPPRPATTAAVQQRDCKGTASVDSTSSESSPRHTMHWWAGLLQRQHASAAAENVRQLHTSTRALRFSPTRSAHFRRRTHGTGSAMHAAHSP